METTLKRIQLLGTAALLGACQPLPPAEPAGLAGSADGPAFAQARCGGCHAVLPFRTSPNPNAPPFPAIVNQQGVTTETLSFWLRDAHNYPGEMEFELGAREVDALVEHMLTLRDPNYRRPPG